MKIITGRRHCDLTEEAHRLTTMDDNNTLTVFARYYTRSLFPLPAFLAHLSRRLKGELIVYRSIRRPLVSASVRPWVRG